jgi:hypothetical protein
MSNRRGTPRGTIRPPDSGGQRGTAGGHGGDTQSQHTGDSTAPSEGAVHTHAHEWIRVSDVEWQCNQCVAIADRVQPTAEYLDRLTLEHQARKRHPTAGTVSARERMRMWDDYHKQIDDSR